MNKQDIQNYINNIDAAVGTLAMANGTQTLEVQRTLDNGLDWNLTIFDQLRFSRIFREMSGDKAHVTFDQVEEYSKLKERELIDIWCLCNPDYTSILNREQFTVFNWLMQEKEKGKPLPATLRNILRMPEKYCAVVKCNNKLNEHESTEKVSQQPSQIDIAMKGMQTKLDRLNDAVNKHKQNCNETKQILEALKAQTENMLKSLYKREICITNEQIENSESVAPKLQHTKEEIIALQQECATSVSAIKAKFQELEVVEDKIEHLINEAQHLNQEDEIVVGLKQLAKLEEHKTSSNPFSNAFESTEILIELEDDEKIPLLDLTFDMEE